MVPWYLMSSYLYYIRDESLLTDPLFDRICKEMLGEYVGLQHIHKHLVNPEHLEAGTCFLRGCDYPARTRSAACSLAKIPFRLEDGEQRPGRG